MFLKVAVILQFILKLLPLNKFNVRYSALKYFADPENTEEIPKKLFLFFPIDRHQCATEGCLFSLNWSYTLSKWEWIRQAYTANREKSKEQNRIFNCSLGTNESDADERCLLCFPETERQWTRMSHNTRYSNEQESKRARKWSIKREREILLDLT